MLAINAEEEKSGKKYRRSARSRRIESLTYTIRCDEAQPRCRNCSERNEECVMIDLRISKTPSVRSPGRHQSLEIQTQIFPIMGRNILNPQDTTHHEVHSTRMDLISMSTTRTYYLRPATLITMVFDPRFLQVPERLKGMKHVI